jgi:hypothetical protein
MAELVNCSGIRLARLSGSAAHPGLDRVAQSDSEDIEIL